MNSFQFPVSSFQLSLFPLVWMHFACAKSDKLPAAIACCLLLLASCANIVTPTGGAKDEQPPQVVQATPENLSTRFTWNKITLTFDEYIKLENASQEIVISPAIEPEPKFHIKGRKLEIDFKGATLDSNTTYTINFGESLKDVNESNPLPNFQYVFSTGDELDSLSISGKVMLANVGKPASKVLVMLYKELNDSVLMTKKPFYFTKTDNNGNFRLNNLKQAGYKLFALKDENFNYRYDLPNEEIAFGDSALNVDNNINGIALRLFREEREIPLKRTGLDDKRKGFIRLIYSRGVEEVEVKSVADGFSIAASEYNKGRDTIIAWYTRAVANDTLRLIVNEDSVEEISVRNIPHDADSLKQMFSAFSFTRKDSLVAAEGWITATLNQPMLGGEFGNVVVEQDSPGMPIKAPQIKFTGDGSRLIGMDFMRHPNTSYTIILPAGTLVNYFGTPNAPLLWKVKTKSEEDYGSLKLSISGQQNQRYLLQMLDKNENPVKESSFASQTILEFDKLQPGSYEIRIIYDSNANGKWDTGNFLQRLQPERTYLHPEKINVRANWDMEVEMKLQ